MEVALRLTRAQVPIIAELSSRTPSDAGDAFEDADYKSIMQHADVFEDAADQGVEFSDHRRLRTGNRIEERIGINAVRSFL